MNSKTPTALLIAWFTLGLVTDSPVHAAADRISGGITGVIEGRVYNPATGEYLRNAEVRVQGTGIIELTAADGRYHIATVPAGPATVIVN